MNTTDSTNEKETPARVGSADGSAVASDYGMHLRLGLVDAPIPVTEKADALNLLEDILDTSRSVDDVVEDYLNGNTSKVYQPNTPIRDEAKPRSL